jgi:DNA-binding FrmR family transcriptional regulator
MLGEDKKKKEKVLVNLKKARSHIEKVAKMVKNDGYCIDIIQQVLAVQGLLRSAQTKILESHLKTCFKRGIEGKSKRKKEKLIQEILQVIKLGD